MGTKTVIDCTTGKATEVEQTPEEIAQADAAGTPTWTAAETRVILAALVLDLAARRTR